MRELTGLEQAALIIPSGKKNEYIIVTRDNKNERNTSQYN
jgi:hypothetical protein